MKQSRLPGCKIDKIISEDGRVSYNGRIFKSNISGPLNLMKVGINSMSDLEVEDFDVIKINNTTKTIEVDGKVIDGEDAELTGFALRIAVQSLKGKSDKGGSREFMYSKMIGEKVDEEDLEDSQSKIGVNP